MAWVKFLVVAVIVMAVCLAGIGGWLLPRFGLEPTMARIVGAATGGAVIALLFFRMRPGASA